MNKNLPRGRLFFKAQTSCTGVDVMTELEELFRCKYMKTKKNKGFWKKKREPKKQKRKLKRLAEEREAIGRRGPEVVEL